MTHFDPAWQPIETAPKEDYAEILVAVPHYDERKLTLRTAMWDPENGDWTVFMANWNPAPVYWMPAPVVPPMPDHVQPTMISDRLRSHQRLPHFEED